MSNKLNAEEMAENRWPRLLHTPQEIMKASENAICAEFEQNSIRAGYAAAIREVAQPIADERDELRELLDIAMKSLGTYGSHPIIEMHYRTVLAKYPK